MFAKLLFSIFLLTLLASSFGFSDDFSEVKTLKKSLESLFDQNNPCLINYSIRETSTQEYMQLIGASSPGVDFAYEAEFAVKGQKFVSTSHAPNIIDGKVTPKNGVFKNVFDGQKSIMRDGTTTQGEEKSILKLSASKQAFGTASDPWNSTGFRFALLILDTCLSNKDDWTTEFKEKEHGRKWLELRTSSGWLHVIEFEKQNLIKSIRVFDEKGWPTVEYTDINYEEFEGVMFPVSGMSTNFDAGTRALPIKKQQYKLLEYDSNPPNSLFEIEIPDDAVVYDHDEGRMLRDSVAIDAKLSEIADLKPNSGISWRTLLMNVGFISIAVVSLLIWFRRGEN